MLAHCEFAWGGYRVSARQHVDVLAQLSLLLLHVRWIVKPDNNDNFEEELRLPSGYCCLGA